MDLNADFAESVLVHSESEPWVASPMPGVERRMLDRIGGEVARATTIVRYAPGSAFSAHTHDGGEEFVVLDGVFQDEHGDYPAGTYVRNPPTSRHTPGSKAGCSIFVKLWQFDADDREAVRKDMSEELGDADNGIASALLHRDARETVRYFEAEPAASVHLDEAGGTEVLVIAGTATAGGVTLQARSWLRLPEGEPFDAVVGPKGVTLWTKTGHLPHARAPGV